jgi:hypothetical protein
LKAIEYVEDTNKEGQILAFWKRKNDTKVTEEIPPEPEQKAPLFEELPTEVLLFSSSNPDEMILNINRIHDKVGESITKQEFSYAEKLLIYEFEQYEHTLKLIEEQERFDLEEITKAKLQLVDNVRYKIREMNFQEGCRRIHKEIQALISIKKYPLVSEKLKLITMLVERQIQLSSNINIETDILYYSNLLKSIQDKIEEFGYYTRYIHFEEDFNKAIDLFKSYDICGALTKLDNNIADYKPFWDSVNSNRQKSMHISMIYEAAHTLAKKMAEVNLALKARYECNQTDTDPEPIQFETIHTNLPPPDFSSLLISKD